MTDAAAAGRLRPQYQDLATQAHAARVGMWAFLASELLFFGALFALYAGYRAEYASAFARATRETDLVLGSVNTGLLITASLVVALAVAAVREARARAASWLLASAAALGIAFLALKGIEYAHHFGEGIYPGAWYRYPGLPGQGAKVFFTLYYLMTGLHALHVAAGVVLLLALAVTARRGRFTPEWHTPLELGGLYWHLVDVIWIFLWPLFYLIH